MDTLSDNIGVYAEAKGEYTRQLTSFLVPALLEYFLKLLEETTSKDTDAKKLLWNFQNILKEIPDWNIDKVKRETGRVIAMTKCDYMEELLTAVFIAHTKVLSAIRLTNKSKKLQITIPKLDHFLHRTLSDSARILWSNVYFFSPTGSSVERQKALNSVESLLHDGVLQSIRSMLPVKSILREYLNDDDNGGDDDEAPKVEEAAPKVEEAVPKVEEPVKIEEPVKVEEPVKIEEPIKIEEPVKVEEPIKIEEPVKVEEPPALSTVAEPPLLTAYDVQKPATRPSPVLVIDTEPMVRFSNVDTVFDSNDPSKNIMKEIVENEFDVDNLFVEADTAALDETDDFEELS